MPRCGYPRYDCRTRGPLFNAHRLSTVRECDRIMVVAGGSIAEEGAYEELIEKGGIFAELVERQRIDDEP